MHTYAHIIHHVSKYNLFVLQIKSIFYEWIIDLTIHVTALITCTCIYMYVCTDLEIMENTCIYVFIILHVHI